MKLEEIKVADIDTLEARATEILSENSEELTVEDLEARAEEAEAIKLRKEELKAEVKAEAELREKIAEGEVPVTVIAENIIPQEERKMENKITTNSEEYRSMFYEYIAGNTELRGTLISVDGGTAGDAIAIPKTLDEKIWDNIHTAHPILEDISTVASGVVMEVTKHTAIAVRVSKKADNAAGAGAEDNTFVKVSLVGSDYEKYVELTYAEAKMSQGALEDYLAQEISAELGEALAGDVFAQIMSDAGSTQKVTATADMFKDIKDALALASMGGKKTIYAPSTSYYEIVGAIKSGSPFNIGTTLGVEVKCDDAATAITVVDPKSFILNKVSDVLIESDKDIKAHKIIVSGWMRAEGCLRINKAAAYIQ